MLKRASLLLLLSNEEGQKLYRKQDLSFSIKDKFWGERFIYVWERKKSGEGKQERGSLRQTLGSWDHNLS